jgi:hypothetical protein
MGLSLVFEMGLGSIIIRKLSGLKFLKRARVCSDLPSFLLIIFTLRQFIKVSIMFFLSVYFVGSAYFYFFIESVQYLYLNLLVYSFAVSLFLICTAFLILIEGFGGISDVLNFRAIWLIINFILFSILLVTPLKFFSFSFASLFSSIFLIWLILRKHFRVNWKSIKKYIRILKSNKGKYDKGFELSRIRKRTGLTWISGYVTTQLFFPILAMVSEQSFSSKFGYHYSMLNGGVVLSLSVISIYNAKFSELIASSQFDKLIQEFKSSALYSFGIFIFFSFGYIMVSIYLGLLENDSKVIIIYVLSFTLISYLINSLAIFIRAWNEEPLLEFSVSLAFIQIIVFIIGVYLGSTFFLLCSLLIINFIFLIGFIIIFKTYLHSKLNDQLLSSKRYFF